MEHIVNSTPIVPADPTTTATLTEEVAAIVRGPLTDAELETDHPAVFVLVKKIEAVAEDAPYMADPRQGVKRIAQALSDYFRTPDAP